MLSRLEFPAQPRLPRGPLDRVVVCYLTLPLIIFLAGWFQWWLAAPLEVCVAVGLWALWAHRPEGGSREHLTPLQISVALATGCAWALFGGADHILFANMDWLMRDAVLHDLVVSRWPVGYGPLDGTDSLLRAPLGFYLPAALAGKWLGLRAAFALLGLWTAAGAALFLLQVFSLLPSRPGPILVAAATIVLFSGFDIIGNIINIGPHFIAGWKIAQHLEWWAGSYQYSAMTTQLFWVPNHAIGGWLIIGLLARSSRPSELGAALPMALVAAALWSPLSAVGVLPFVAWRVFDQALRETDWRVLHPRIWMPAVPAGIAVSAFLILDPGGISKGVAVGGGSASDLADELLRQAQFWLLEAGIIGFVLLSIRPSAEILIALFVLAVLPLVHLGPANDLVMRGSIPSLAALAIGACLCFTRTGSDPALRRKKALLAGLLAIGAVTAIQEFARTFVLRPWPINLEATMVGVSCGAYPPHYIARLQGGALREVLRAPQPITGDPHLVRGCLNPAFELMWEGNLL